MMKQAREASERERVLSSQGNRDLNTIATTVTSLSKKELVKRQKAAAKDAMQKLKDKAKETKKLQKESRRNCVVSSPVCNIRFLHARAHWAL